MKRKSRPFLTSTPTGFNPNRCHEPICEEQRVQVDRQFSHLKYKEKFEFLNRCLNCATFYPNELRVCPCCKKNLRFRPKHHNKTKGYDNDDDSNSDVIIGY